MSRVPSKIKAGSRVIWREEGQGGVFIFGGRVLDVNSQAGRADVTDITIYSVEFPGGTKGFQVSVVPLATHPLHKLTSVDDLRYKL
jgi:hypothetical protein